MPSLDASTLTWLIRLRFAAIAAYAFLIASTWFLFRPPLSFGFLAALLFTALCSNLALQAWGDSEGPAPRALTGFVLILDTLLLTGLLHASGGPANPFSAIYLVHVALAASALGPRWGWTIAGLSTLAYAFLFLWQTPLGHLEHPMEGHLFGMWIALAVSSGLIAQFVGMQARSLARRNREIAALQIVAERDARLAALTTLAAGAAHELATPLSTIAVVSKDLMNAVESNSVKEEAALIQQELQRCRVILDQLSWKGGELAGEPQVLLDVGKWWVECAEEWPDRVRVILEPARLHLPRRSFTMVMRALIKNALDASNAEQIIRVRGRVISEGRYRFQVIDEGIGMSAELAARALEPFFTTKGEAGMGLGLFLAKDFARRMGGSLELIAHPVGTEAQLILPREL
jgi:two-component system, sensor histidine kinase RegB